MRGIICYDLTDNKQRNRLVKILSKYGSRIQYSVFQFNLDKQTWKKLIQSLVDRNFTDGIHNIIIIPITDSDHSKIINLGEVFIPFDYETVIYSALGNRGIKERDWKDSKSKTKNKNSTNKLMKIIYNEDPLDK